jgi:SAM-dependent methyltransferase
MPQHTPVADAWQDGALGRALVAAEASLLAEAYQDVFGWELLQLGIWGPAATLLGGSRTRRQTIISGSPGTTSQTAEGAPLNGASDSARTNPSLVVARLTQLPVANASVDAVVLPHTLEFEPDPYALVREADRVLAGEGQLLVLGFRPFSLWGLRAAVARAGFPPGLRRLLPLRRLRDWLELLGYEIVETRPYLYHPPWGEPRADDIGRAQFLRRGILNALPAGAYLLKARKRVYTLTPIRPRFRETRKILGGLVEPTPRRPS